MSFDPATPPNSGDVSKLLDYSPIVHSHKVPGDHTSLPILINMFTAEYMLEHLRMCCKQCMV